MLAWILYKKLRILNNWSIGYPAARELSGKANKFLANVDGWGGETIYFAAEFDPSSISYMYERKIGALGAVYKLSSLKGCQKLPILHSKKTTTSGRGSKIADFETT